MLFQYLGDAQEKVSSIEAVNKLLIGFWNAKANLLQFPKLSIQRLQVS